MMNAAISEAHRSRQDENILPRWLIASKNYRAVSSDARAVLVELLDQFNGSNNGRLKASVRALGAKIRKSRSSAHRALLELQLARLIELAIPSGFERRNGQPSKYRLTMYECDVTGAPPLLLPPRASL